MTLDDADTFARWHVASGDIDPVYPVLGWLVDWYDMDTDDQVSFVLLYVAYYDLASAMRTWSEGWRMGKELTDAQLRYSTGTERRAHRDVRQFRRHIESMNALVAHYGGPDRMFTLPDDHDRFARWMMFQHRLGTIHGNGRWAGYKTGEILDTVLERNCPPPDAGHAFSSGPRKGLADLVPSTAVLTGNDPGTVAVLDHHTAALVERWGIPVAQVETVLCDWHSTVHGNYYVGHDIDLMLGQAMRTPSSESDLILVARANLFDPRWLGEFRGWGGVRKELKTAYRDRGVIEWWS